jgi:hypothetical protein
MQRSLNGFFFISSNLTSTNNNTKLLKPSQNAVTGSVAEDQADAGFAALYHWHSTFLWTDYTTALSTAGVTCLVPKPNMLPSWMSLWLPFSTVMWAAVSVSLLIITVVFYMLAKASERYLGM